FFSSCSYDSNPLGGDKRVIPGHSRIQRLCVRLNFSAAVRHVHREDYTGEKSNGYGSLPSFICCGYLCRSFLCRDIKFKVRNGSGVLLCGCSWCCCDYVSDDLG